MDLLTNTCCSKLSWEPVSVVSAIKGSNQQPGRGIVGRTDRINDPAVISSFVVLRATFFIFLAVCLVLVDGPAAASDFMVPVKSIAQITIDDDNRELNYPVSVFFDPVEEETYLINGGSNRVVVYGPDFFPRVSIGNGRGVLTPRGIRVMSNGEVFICQVKSSRNPSPRITILNGAFFVDREIFLDQIPEAADFRPKDLVVSRDNIIYLAGDNMRGVLVLDNDGNFLRWLRPEEEITISPAEAAKRQAEEEKQAEKEQPFSVEVEERTPEENIYADIPEEFRPRSEEERASRPQEGIGPVKINHINIDSAGNLYLISAEVGKIYVYGPDESLRFSFGIKGGSPGQMSNPRSLAIDEEHRLIYVTDYMRHTILIYDMDTGEYLAEFGGRGFNPTWFNFPSGITINNYGQVIIADVFNRRVQVLEVGFEAVSHYRDALSSGAVESGDQEEPVPGQPDTLSDQEEGPELTLEQAAALIRRESSQDVAPPVEPLPETSGAAAAPEQDEPVAEQAQEPGEEKSIQDVGPPVESLPEASGAAAAPEQDKPVAEQAQEPDEEKSSQDVEPSGQPDATAALPDIDAVDAFVRSWAAAWEQQDIEAYLSHYARDFITPGGIAITAWEKQRHKSLGRPRFIKIGIRDMRKEKVSDTQARVTFIQEYQSDTYSDQVAKTLDLIWENGEWKIAKEESTPF